MPTIKVKKEINLVELLEWIWKNDIKNKDFECKKENRIKHIVHVAPSGEVDLDSGGYYEKSDTFIVEVEEEITEDTLIPKIITLFKSNPLISQDDRGKQRAFITKNASIQIMLNRAKSQRENIDTIHIISNDGTHTLIWRDGKLVD